MTTDCAICCEKYNKSNRKKITCKTCNFEACNKCCETFLLGLQDDPHCMSCKARWTNMFMFENFTKTFNNITFFIVIFYSFYLFIKIIY